MPGNPFGFASCLLQETLLAFGNGQRPNSTGLTSCLLQETLLAFGNGQRPNSTNLTSSLGAGNKLQGLVSPSTASDLLK